MLTLRQNNLLKHAQEQLDPHLKIKGFILKHGAQYLEIECTIHNETFDILHKHQVNSTHKRCPKCITAGSVASMWTKMEEYEVKVTGKSPDYHRNKPRREWTGYGKDITKDIIDSEVEKYLKSGGTITKLSVEV